MRIKFIMAYGGREIGDEIATYDKVICDELIHRRIAVEMKGDNDETKEEKGPEENVSQTATGQIVGQAGHKKQRRKRGRPKGSKNRRR